MIRFAIPITSMLLIASTSLANPAHHLWTDGSHKPFHTWNQTVMKNGLVHAGPRIPPKVKLLRSNPHRLTAIRFQDVDPLDAPDDEYLCSAVSRPRVVHEPETDDVSDLVKTRLFIARMRALQRYRENWS